MALIKDTPTLLKYVAVGQKLTIELVAPYIDHAAKSWLIPLIGQALYDDIDAATSPTVAQTALIPYLQKTLANLAVVAGINILAVSISGSGVNMDFTDTKRPAFQYMTDAAKEDLARIGFEALEEMLAFLDVHKTDYPLWTASDAFKAAKAFFINTADEFTKYYSIRNSRRTFIQLYPYIRKVEDFILKPVLGLTYFAELKTKILAANLNTDDKAIMDYLKPGLVYHVMANAFAILSVEITDTGILLNGLKAIKDSNKEAVSAADSKLQKLMDSAKSDGETYIRLLHEYLNKFASASKYPTYFADTSVYISPTTGTDTVTLLNDPTSRIYGAI